jgi:hypothetical protein
MANAPLLRRDAQILPMIWVDDQSHDLRQIGTTGKSVEMAKLLSSEQQLLQVIVIASVSQRVARMRAR